MRVAAAGTAIYFLLKAGERSHWHRVDADEIWHHYAGAPLELSMSDDGRAVRHLRLGSRFRHRRAPQAVVPRHVWQAARSLGAWTLVGCTVAPAFEFEGFELAPPGWEPGPSDIPAPPQLARGEHRADGDQQCRNQQPLVGSARPQTISSAVDRIGVA